METGPATTSISGADLRMGLRLGSAFQNLLAPLVLLDVDLASGEPLLEDRERPDRGRSP